MLTRENSLSRFNEKRNGKWRNYFVFKCKGCTAAIKVLSFDLKKSQGHCKACTKPAPYKRNYNAMVSGGKSRGIAVSITFDEFLTFVEKPCHYCTGSIPWHKTSYYLDRMDSDKDYSFDNCVPCCTYCNTRKGTTSYQSFISKNEYRP